MTQLELVAEAVGCGTLSLPPGCAARRPRAQQLLAALVRNDGEAAARWRDRRRRPPRAVARHERPRGLSACSERWIENCMADGCRT
jgi:hypothetical protein